MLKAALFSESLLMFSGISGEGWLLRRGRHIHGVSGHRPNAAVLPRAVQRRLPGKSGQKPPTNVADRGVQKIGARFFQDVVWSVFGSVGQLSPAESGKWLNVNGQLRRNLTFILSEPGTNFCSTVQTELMIPEPPPLWTFRPCAKDQFCYK